jgi:hypothetical protein
MGGRDDLCTLMRRPECGDLDAAGEPGGKSKPMRAEQASECGDPYAESCGQPARGGEAVRPSAANAGRGEVRFSPLCLLMNPILPGAVHRDLAGET